MKLIAPALILLLIVVVSLAQDTTDTPYDVAPWPLPGHRPQPEYPRMLALANYYSGEISMIVHIDSSGAITAIDKLRENPEGLGMETAVRSALMGWEYAPALKNRKSVSSVDTLNFVFGRLDAEYDDIVKDSILTWSMSKTISDQLKKSCSAYYSNVRTDYLPLPILYNPPKIVIDKVGKATP